jgi:purine nucleosidase
MKPNHKKPVFFDHDGSNDDLVALILFLHFGNFRLNGISVTDGAGEISASVELCLRILKKMNVKGVHLAKSQAVPINPFPEAWRSKTAKILDFECMHGIQPDVSMLSPLEGSEFLANTILAEEEKTILLLTGPATNFVTALERYPLLKNKVEKVIWMAGAFMHDGNVNVPDHDGSAEWNIFWDPASAQKLITSGLPLTMVPIDVCSMVPADRYFMHQLNECTSSQACHMVHKILSMLFGTHESLYLYDLVAAAYLGCPQLARTEKASINIEQRGTSTGNVFKTENGGSVEYLNYIDDEMFYDFVVGQLSSHA